MNKLHLATLTATILAHSALSSRSHGSAKAETFAAHSATPDAPGKPPNLLFIFPDQWRGQALGFLGQEPVKTPVIDRLASQGVVMTHAMSNTPICVPFRTMLMTGAYPHSNRVLCNCYMDKTPRTPNPDCRWWSDVLNDKGYELGMVGKWHIPPPTKTYQGKPVGQKDSAWVPPASRHNFKYWFHLNGNNHRNPRYWDAAASPSDVKHTQKWSPIFEADRIIDFLKNRDGKLRDAGKPFAMVWSVNPPHMPYNTAPEEYRKPYETLDIEAHCRQYADIPPADKQWGKYYRHNIKGYYAQMTGVDAQIGRVLDCLKELNLENDTIVIFTSDHGDCLGRHNEISKSNPYQESVSIPCIIRWPGKIKPRRDDVLFNAPDFYPTMLSLAGFKASIPSSVEGTDHASLLLGGDAARPTSQLYCMQGYTDPSMGERGVRTHTHTMVLKQKAADQPFNITLYDNIKDPFQMTNIAAQQPQLVKQLIEKELRPWLERTRDPWLKKATPLPACLVGAGEPAAPAQTERWSAEKAWSWYKSQPWLVGFNFVPSTACNTTEWWQEETFDPVTIDRELGWAHDLGFNTTRVFIQYIVWKQDPDGFKKRFEKFLSLAGKHGISVMPTLFDDCAFGAPQQMDPFLGKQREPIPGMILSSWTPSPGRKLANDPAERPMLKRYVQDMLATYGKDKRVVVWDLYNEPMNMVGVGKPKVLEEMFIWAREARPDQPLTMGYWTIQNVSNPVMLEQSDVISFHSYSDQADGPVKNRIAALKKHGRPVICTEWMARAFGQRWDKDLPVFKQQGVGCYSWGFVNGRTQCQFAWGSKRGAPEPKVWFHDLFHKDGKPYDPAEHEVIRKTTADKTLDWTTIDTTTK